MNTNIKDLQKRTYSPPRLEQIKLDNEISLVLESPNPEEEPLFTNANESIHNDPFKTNIG